MSSGVMGLLLAMSLFCSSSSAMPAAPLPDTAWYEDAMMDLRPYFLWSGKRAMSEMMVVQLGLAIMFLGADRAA